MLIQMLICFPTKTLTLPDGFYKIVMIKKYKPKQANVKKLEIFLKKIENKIEKKDGIKHVI